MTERLELIKQNHNFGFCPIVYIEKNEDCELIWQKAKLETDKKYPDFTAHSWRIGENEKPVLVYSLDNYHDALLFFWENLKNSAGDSWQSLKNNFVELSSDEVAELNHE